MKGTIFLPIAQTPPEFIPWFNVYVRDFILPDPTGRTEPKKFEFVSQFKRLASRMPELEQSNSSKVMEASKAIDALAVAIENDYANLQRIVDDVTAQRIPDFAIWLLARKFRPCGRC